MMPAKREGAALMMYCLCTVDTMGFSTFIDQYFHTSARVKSSIEAVGARVVILPAYSPELNPIERLWSKVKTYLRSKMPKSFQDFHSRFIEALSMVTENDCEG